MPVPAHSFARLDPEDRRLLSQLRRGPRSRAELSDQVHLSRNTVAGRLDRLIGLGWAVQAEGPQGERGRPAQLYALNALAQLIFAARFDSARITAAILTMTGEPLITRSLPLDRELDPDAAVALLQQLMAEMTASPGVPRDRLGLAVIGAKGPVADGARTIAWSRVGVLPSDLSDRLGLPTLVENDANLMALGYACGLPLADSVLFVLVQAGIGGGLVINGQLHRGLAGWAGEIGHIPVAAARGIACSCGAWGCVANIADNVALMRNLSRADRPLTTEDDLRALALDRNVEALGALRQAGCHLGEALTPLVIGLAPAKVVVGGPIISASEDYVSGVREVLSSRTPPAISALLQVTTTRADAQLANLGCRELALDHILGVI